jgi:hypothetical protein
MQPWKQTWKQFLPSWRPWMLCERRLVLQFDFSWMTCERYEIYENFVF